MSETVLITGASSGIGYELAKLFAEANHSLVLVSRNEEKLNQLRLDLVEKHSVHVEVIAADLSKVNAADDLMAELDNRKILVDVLVNNAGFGELGSFDEITLDRQLAMVRLNVVTLMHLAHLLLPEMLKRDHGGILNVASVAAFQPGPNMAVYYATKAFVLSFSEALHEELSGTNVSVTCLAPGPTKTGFAEDSGMNATKMFESNAMGVLPVAQQAFDAFAKNKAIVIPGWRNKMISIMPRIFPRFLIRKIVKKLQSPS